MVRSHYGLSSDMFEIRRLCTSSLKGATLQQVMNNAARVGFTSRAVRLELEELANLPTPCILHWNLNHFVVLVKVGKDSITILDPAIGRKTPSLPEVSKCFTGVALELAPKGDIQREKTHSKIRLRSILGKVVGFRAAIWKIIIVALMLELFSIAAPLYNQLVVDEALATGDRNLLTILALGFGLLLLIQVLIGVARSWMLIVLGQTLSVQWTNNVFAHLVRLPLEFFEKRHVGDIASRFSAVQTIQKTLTNAAIEAILDGVMAVAALIMMLLYSPKLAAVTVAAVLIYGIVRWASYSHFRDATSERLVVSAKENSFFLETLRAMAPVKLFSMEDGRRARWQNLMVEVLNRDALTAKLTLAYTATNTLIFGFENIVVLWLGASIVLNAPIGGSGASNLPFTIGMLFAYIGYKAQFSARVSALINYGIELRMLRLHVERLSDIVLSPAETAEAHDNGGMLSPSVELINVSFRYSDGEPWVLRDVNIRIQAGENIAITGSSGGGKTTLMKVALGLLTPTTGEVRFGGKSISQLGLHNFRRQVGTVMQDDVLLSGSILDNISFFDNTCDPRHAESCAQFAQVHEEIMRMPMGYRTLVGDLGSGLSGGQRQRILLARALYKRPQMLVLDEATSHLDVVNERVINAALRGLDLTRVTIAHRPETIASADRVMAVDRGQVAEVAIRRSASNELVA